MPDVHLDVLTEKVGFTFSEPPLRNGMCEYGFSSFYGTESVLSGALWAWLYIAFSGGVSPLRALHAGRVEAAGT